MPAKYSLHRLKKANVQNPLENFYLPPEKNIVEFHVFKAKEKIYCKQNVYENIFVAELV